jgi:acyl-CoA thioester hydrolase
LSAYAWPVAIELPLLWGQMDALGHLNNTAYLRFFEEARIVLFDRADLRAVRAATRVGPILAATSVQFLRPLVHPDTVRVEAGVRTIGRTSFVMDYRITSLRVGTLSATGDSVVVLYDYERETKVPIPDDLRAALQLLTAPIAT